MAIQWPVVQNNNQEDRIEKKNNLFDDFKADES